MVTDALLKFLFKFLTAIFSTNKIPPLPEQLVSYFYEFEYYILDSNYLLNLFFDVKYLMTLLEILVFIEIFMFSYHMVMWVYKKVK